MFGKIFLVLLVGVLVFVVMFLAGRCPKGPTFFSGHDWSDWQDDAEGRPMQHRRCEYCKERQTREG